MRKKIKSEGSKQMKEINESTFRKESEILGGKVRTRGGERRGSHWWGPGKRGRGQRLS